MKQLYGFWLAFRIEYHWWYILRYRKRGIGMIESGVTLSSPEPVSYTHLARKWIGRFLKRICNISF